MRNANRPAVRYGAAVKEIIDALEEKFGSLREAGRALNIDHQKLSKWRRIEEKARGVEDFLDELERIRNALKIPKSRFWGRLRGQQ